MGQIIQGGLLASLAMVVALTATSLSATPTSQNREYGGGGQGPVVFSFETHARGGGLVCEDCHSPNGTGLFEPKRYEFKMHDHNKGKFCWACHDGKQAEQTCDSCHY
ncbi:MAG: c(7)-type cytochrome triheme domain-containing protein [Shewanella sp.]